MIDTGQVEIASAFPGLTEITLAATDITIQTESDVVDNDIGLTISFATQVPLLATTKFEFWIPQSDFELKGTLGEVTCQGYDLTGSSILP